MCVFISGLVIRRQAVVREERSMDATFMGLLKKKSLNQTSEG